MSLTDFKVGDRIILKPDSEQPAGLYQGQRHELASVNWPLRLTDEMFVVICGYDYFRINNTFFWRTRFKKVSVGKICL